MEYAGHREKPVETNEAVPNPVRGATDQHYEDKVAACLKESRRALCSKGRLVLTFHNKDLKAWEALAKALQRASFEVVALAAVAAENPADHSKRGKRSFLSDLVIECRPKGAKRRRCWQLTVRGTTGSAERKNLEAIGLALAECVNSGEGNLEALFNAHMTRLKGRKKFICRGGK
jgi:adenine-specific DNA methylase